jgi:hypothetical protein
MSTMPQITNRVLTTPGQQLTDAQKRNARRNINAMAKPEFPSGSDKEYVMCAVDGQEQWSELELVDDPIDP